ncbi:MAG TPA: methylated-DNA--[protein]-cysteine S-methyltransferase [Candidatus Limnocylindrales bacterium]|nr:methylated-DNA--[protein]-cysteine S-methyltransferase [Candidatus Limnocylindrales bacterium]
MRTHTEIDSPIGRLTLVATDGVLSGVYMEGHLHGPDPATLGPRDDAAFTEAICQLDEYFRGTRRSFTIPMAPGGTPFQRRVWAALLRIPYGRTMTYGDLAAEVADRSMARAVGAATGRNPLSVVIPCHRLVGSDGSLTGYAGGLVRKRTLLDLERGVVPFPGWSTIAATAS